MAGLRKSYEQDVTEIFGWIGHQSSTSSFHFGNEPGVDTITQYIRRAMYISLYRMWEFLFSKPYYWLLAMACLSFLLYDIMITFLSTGYSKSIFVFSRIQNIAIPCVRTGGELLAFISKCFFSIKYVTISNSTKERLNRSIIMRY